MPSGSARKKPILSTLMRRPRIIGNSATLGVRFGSKADVRRWALSARSEYPPTSGPVGREVRGSVAPLSLARYPIAIAIHIGNPACLLVEECLGAGGHS